MILDNHYLLYCFVNDFKTFFIDCLSIDDTLLMYALFLIPKAIRTVEDDQQRIKIEIWLAVEATSMLSITKIKEKEDAKKAQKREHTPYQEPHVIPQPQVQQKMVFQPPIQYENQQNAFKSDREMQK